MLGGSVPTSKHIAQRTLQLHQDRIKSSQSDRLLAPFQPEDRGRWQTDFFAELGERHVATLISQPFGQFLVQW